MDLIYDVLGTIGVAIIIGSYFALQTDRLNPRGLLYSTLNAAGAALILLSLVHDFNWAAFLVEAFWLLISLFGMARRLTAPPPPPRGS